MQRFLIIAGVVLLLAGLAWPLLSKLPLGRLPGDIVIDRPGVKVYIPLATMIVASVLLTLLFSLFRR
ncbi:MAG TPA: DUF2905 domain-containing protein [Verrucomicrobiales bacterium]|nr:DUF2905 domain-containing protein [Verrucomicrobiales bacterium]